MTTILGCCLNRAEFWVAFVTFFGQGFALYLTLKMIKFASRYGKPWANAFRTFFLIMFICLLRRVMVISWVMGLDGELGEPLQWVDHVILHFLLTVLYVVFLLQLVRWWKDFFEHFNARFG